MSEITESQLKMLGLYFSKFDFRLDGPLDENTLKNSITITHSNKVNDPNQVRIQIDLKLEDDAGLFELYLQTLGFFQLENSENLSEDLAKSILEKNTVAIMLPFIRSQISLLTTQPGMTPIMLPPVDVNALMKQNSD